MHPLPLPRGPLSAWVRERLTGFAAEPPTVRVAHPLRDDDIHLALHMCYQLHYTGFDGVDDGLEWDLELLMFRAALEAVFEEAVREAVGDLETLPEGPLPERLDSIVSSGTISSSRFLERDGTVQHYREFLIHRSTYHLMEADPHTWAIPRLEGPTKAALIEIQFDEYGGGDPRWMHSRLFAASMRALSVDPTPGVWIDRLPGSSLAPVNLITLFGLHRRLRGALIGHLAAFEMDSCIPNRRYATGLRRLGFGDDATRYFDEHVEADAVHGPVAAHDLAGSLIDGEPELEDDVIFGARALRVLDADAGARLLGAWSRGRTSLREPELSLA